MERSRIIEICQWDFLTYSEALDLSPHRKQIISYPQKPLTRVGEPCSNEVSCEVRRLQIRREPFGFFNWIPINQDDRSLVLEFKVKPKPWTKYCPPNKQKQAQVTFITSTLETLLEANGFLVGASCIEDGLEDMNFSVAFARSESNRFPVFINFSIPHQEMLECPTQQDKLNYLDLVCRYIIRQRDVVHRGGDQ